MEINRFINKDNIFAVIGVSEDKTKYGYKVFNDLKSSGYKVCAVNLKLKSIDNYPCYNSLKQIPEKPDVVITVVPPNMTENIVKEASQLKINKIWMQPGSESEEAIKYCKSKDIQVMSNICIMIKRLK